MKPLTPDKLFRALADENRLRILALLSHGELCVCDLADTLKMSQPKISRHLAYLRRSGLVATRRDEQWIYYALKKTADPFLSRLFRCLTGYFQRSPVFSRDRKTLIAIQKQTCC